jgi:hypothetical protein
MEQPNIEDICAQGFDKEWRMEWAHAFIMAWLTTPEMQAPLTLSMLTIQANRWIGNNAKMNQMHPIISGEDIKEAGLAILGEI